MDDDPPPGLVCAPPAAPLRGHVLGYRGHRLSLPGPRARREVPIGSVNVLLGLGEPVRQRNAVTGRDKGTYASLVAGLHTTATIGEHDGRVHGLEVSLTPMAAFAVFGLPMAELSERSVDLADALGPGTGGLLDRLAGLPDWPSRFALLDGVLAGRLRDGPRWSPEVARAWRTLDRAAGLARVADLARDVGWSRRHLERRFREQVGLSPKSLARVLRLQRALALHDRGHDMAGVAAVSGFYDQAHLLRCYREMVGCTPRQFRAERAAALPAPLDRVPGTVTSAVVAATRTPTPWP